jgi:hypothetical protein
MAETISKTMYPKQILVDDGNHENRLTFLPSSVFLTSC